MYAKSTRPSAKREVQKERSAKRDDKKFRSAKRDDRIARPRRAQTCQRSELRAKRAMRMCPRSGQIFNNKFLTVYLVSPFFDFHPENREKIKMYGLRFYNLQFFSRFKNVILRHHSFYTSGP